MADWLEKMAIRNLIRLTSTRAMAVLDVAVMASLWPATLAMTGIVLRQGNNGAAAVLYPAVEFACLYALGLYRRDVIVETRKALGRACIATGIGTLMVACALIVGSDVTGIHGAGKTDGPRLFEAATACFLVSGIVARVLFRFLRRLGALKRRLLVLGAGKRAWDLAWILRKEGSALNYEITFLHDPQLGDVDPRLADGSSGPVVHVGAGKALYMVQALKSDEIVVAPDERRGMDLDSLLECKIAGYPVQQYLSFVECEIRRIDLKRMELSWLLYSKGFYFGLIDRALKRLLDIVVSSLFLLLFGPVIVAAIVAVKIDDGGPSFYEQERVTRNGRSFRILKLRTMKVDAEKDGAIWAAQGDSRVTRIGAFLRRTRIDEMPQIFNVLRGDMSLVGPRPERPTFVQALTEQIPLYKERHIVRAGLTGWAQVNYPYGASTDDARSKLSYDLYYVKNFNILFDLMIIAQTLRVVLWPGGVR